jgi:mono/diheme cytochrome c family protein
MRRSRPSNRVGGAIRTYAALLFAATASLGLAHDIITTKLTWNREISRVVYKRCASCHREGGTAMALLTFQDVRPWAKAIRDQVVARSMPPWGAVKGVGSFHNDPSLTETEIEMIVAWVEGGAPKGDDDSLAPRLPAEPKAVAEKPHKVQAVAGELQLERPMIVLGVRPESLDDGQSMLVDAWLPDGHIEHLIWLRDYRKSWTRDYLFRTPLKLPAGTTVHVKSPSAAKVLMLL